MTPDKQFDELVDEIMSKGFDEKTAALFARLIGDTPIIDNNGKIVVMENKKILAKLALNFFK